MENFKSIFPIKITQEEERQMLDGKIVMPSEAWNKIINQLQNIDKQNDR